MARPDQRKRKRNGRTAQPKRTDRYAGIESAMRSTHSRKGKVNSRAWSHRDSMGRRSDWNRSPYIVDPVMNDARWDQVGSA